MQSNIAIKIRIAPNSTEKIIFSKKGKEVESVKPRNARLKRITSGQSVLENNDYFKVYLVFVNQLKKSLDDDMRDHWEHHEHETEQKEMLDLIFNTGINHKAKNVMVLSGDVHFGGAARIDKTINKIAYTATQVISSPIVNSPFSAIIGNLSAHFSKDTNDVGQYIISDFKEFGDYKKKMVTQRNFIYIKRSKNGALTLSMFNEPWGKKPYFRNVNNFVNEKG